MANEDVDDEAKARAVADVERSSAPTDAALRRTMALLEKTSAMAKVGGWELDRAAGRLWWSAVTKQLHEVPPDYEPQLDTALQFYKQGESRTRITELVQRAIDEGAPFVEELQLVTHTGKVIWVRAMGEAEFSDDVCARVFGTFQDISERKAHDDELAQAREAADAANKAKTEFLTNVSHEIRTPMNAIFGLTDLLMVTSLTAKQRAYLKRLRSSSQALLHVLNDLLDIAKIEADEIDLVVKELALGDVIARLDGVFDVIAEQRALGLGFTVSDELPGRVIGDFDRICQVLINLVENALKFTKQGRVEVRVQLVEGEVAAGSVLVRFTVQDTGIGIPRDRLDEMFEPFSQVDTSSTRKFGGVGLGLPISARLVALMGGTLEVESELGSGSCFGFTLPLKAVDSTSKASASNSNMSLSELAAQIQGAHVLLVEDNPVNQLVASAILDNAGLEVTTAGDGVEALGCVREQTFDAVLMDAQMPRMDGYAATRELRRLEGLAELPVIAVTAGSMAGDRDACLAAGMNDYLRKPLDSTLLIETLVYWIERRRGSSDPS